MKKLNDGEKLMLAFCAGELSARTGTSTCVNIWQIAEGADLPFARHGLVTSLAHTMSLDPGDFESPENLARIVVAAWRVEEILGLDHAGLTLKLDVILINAWRADALANPWGGGDWDVAAGRIAQDAYNEAERRAA